MNLKFTKHEKLSLKNHPQFSEVWLHDRICDDTSLLGLGNLDVLERERAQHSGGRLDVLMSDIENNTRYEAEIMLGATDPSHIIRCIEYWDIERRRYPAYEHVAVIIAEEITSRFLNVMSLLAGSIPLIAIQLDALQVEEKILLNFVKVLDQRMLREDDTLEIEGSNVDRSWWESHKGVDKLQLCDRLLEIANEKASTPLELRYKKGYVNMSPPGSFFNVCMLWPKQQFVRIHFKVTEAANWVDRLEEAGMDVMTPRAGRLRMRLTTNDLPVHEELVRELVHQAVAEYEA